MLYRPQPGEARSWKRSSTSDVPTSRDRDDARYGNVSDTLDHPEVYDDWSGGLNGPYQDPSKTNGFAWSNNMETRFPRQMIHSQAPQLLASRYASLNTDINYAIDVPLPGTQAQAPGAGAVLVSTKNLVGYLQPTQYPYTAGSAFVFSLGVTAGQYYGGRPALFGSYVYVGDLQGSSYLQLDRTFANGSLGPNQPAQWFEVAAGMMWFGFGNQVRSVPRGSDPAATANYNATLGLGNGFFITRDAIAMEDQLYVGFPDGVYQGNLTGTFNNVMDSVNDAVDLDNCADLTTHQGWLVAAQGPHVWRYKPSSVQSELQEVGPTGLGARSLDGTRQISGKFTAVKGYGRWLYAGLFTGSGSVFMAGHDASPGLPFVWHPLHDFLGLNVKIRHIHVDNITNAGGVQIPARIWAAADASYGANAGATAPLFYWPIPRGDENPLLDMQFSANYMGSAAIEFGASDWNAPSTDKVWRSLRAWGDNLRNPGGVQPANNRYGVFSYITNPIIGAANSVATLGTIPPLSSPSQGVVLGDLYFTVSTNGSINVRGQSIGVRLDSYESEAQTPGANTPVWRSIVTRGFLRPVEVEIIEARVRIADNMPDRAGGRLRPAVSQITDLRAIGSGSAPALLTDISGATQWVTMLGMPDETEQYQAGSDTPETIATIKMAVMDYSAGPI